MNQMKNVLYIPQFSMNDGKQFFLQKDGNYIILKALIKFLDNYGGLFNIKVIITCKEHGDFEQSPAHHLRGQSCPICNLSKGENKIKQLLDKMNIVYNRQHTFDKCVYKRKLQFDFYLPDYNICIEYDGIQHFKPIEFFGGIKSFEECKEKDKIKFDHCIKNNISLLKIPYYDNANIENKIIDFINQRKNL